MVALDKLEYNVYNCIIQLGNANQMVFYFLYWLVYANLSVDIVFCFSSGVKFAGIYFSE